jgi:hypothetical protein
VRKWFNTVTTLPNSSYSTGPVGTFGYKRRRTEQKNIKQKTNTTVSTKKTNIWMTATIEKKEKERKVSVPPFSL